MRPRPLKSIQHFQRTSAQTGDVVRKIRIGDFYVRAIRKEARAVSCCNWIHRGPIVNELHILHGNVRVERNVEPTAIVVLVSKRVEKTHTTAWAYGVAPRDRQAVKRRGNSSLGNVIAG